MAEGITVTSNDVICRFFAAGACHDGEKCVFSHDRSNKVWDNVCRYYLKGRCVFGQNCRYDHVRVQPNSSWKTKNVVPSPNVPKNRTVPNSNTKIGPAKSNPVKQKMVPYGNMKTPNGPGTPNWVYAPEFVPKTNKSYADVVKKSDDSFIYNPNQKQGMSADELCPYFVMGSCPYGEMCSFVHGEVCELCHKACLMPFDEQQQKRHLEMCEKELIKDMEISFAVQRSADKSCGICFDVVMEKQPTNERRFGIMERCNHVFCLTCIRTWRKAKHTESSSGISPVDPEITRTCPECRVPSDFITPSKYWVEDKDEKAKLINEYKEALSKKPCQYFKQGQGTCPFGGACFYLHAYPDGTKVDLPLPKRRRRRDQNGELDFMNRIVLWDFLDFRDDVIIPPDWEDFMYNFSDSYDSDNTSESLSFD